VNWRATNLRNRHAVAERDHDVLGVAKYHPAQRGAKILVSIVESARRAVREPKEKLSQRVAREIMAEIRSRNWPVGELLGTEAELLARFRVSRATLGEAIRQVERNGAAVMRRGTRGGLTITAPATTTIVRTISAYLELSDVALEEQFDAWRIIEVQAVSLATRKTDDDGIAHLRALIQQIDKAESEYEYLSRCMGVRVAIADQIPNPALALFMRVLVRIMSRDVISRRLPPNWAHYRRIRDQLNEIVEAIASGDSALAQGLTRLSLSLRQEHIETRGQRRTPDPSQRDESNNAPTTLAEGIAHRLRDDIAAMGWPEGESLGSERELLLRYGVSRWVLRQALRTLETHAIVRPKRGQGGGLLVGRPNPAYAVDLAVDYLHFAQFTLEDVAEVWGTLLESAVQLAGQRTDADFTKLLAAVAQEESSRTTPEGRRAAAEFYSEIGNLSGNRVIAVFIAILARFISRHRINADLKRLGAIMKQQHRKLAQHLVEGQPANARHTMRDYVELMRPYYTSSIVVWRAPPRA